MTLTASLGLGAYRLAGRLAGPLIRRKLKRRIALGKEDPERIGERFGQASRQRPDGPLIWMHGASVGEALAGLLLIDAIRRDHEAIGFLVTTGTVTSAALLRERLPENAIHQYAPIDLPGVVERFLDHWKPDAALWLESEFWPNTLAALERRAVPIALINGRMSPDSYARWASLRPVIASLLRAFSICLVQTERDARYLADLGAPHVSTIGNLKESAPPLGVDQTALNELAVQVGGRPRWVAASTHPGEEEIAIAAHNALRQYIPGLLTVIAPRHPDRGAVIADLVRDAGLAVALRSQGVPPGANCDVYVADTMGEMGLWYRLCRIAFVGKSLVGSGGQNPLEPAQLGCAVLFGPHMSNFEDIAAEMTAVGAARRVSDAADLTAALKELLTIDAVREAMGSAASGLMADRRMPLDATLAALGRLLTAIEGGATVRNWAEQDAALAQIRE